jgi:phosphoglycerate dehydrogenase-like enzyme
VAELSQAVEPILVDREGHLRQAGNISTPHLQPEIAWMSPEVFLDDCLGAFMLPVLGSGRMRWLQSGAAGFDDPLLQRALRQGIALTVNTAPATSIAEYVFATVLDHFQGGDCRRAARSKREWYRQGFREIAGTTWLTIGFGAIGTRVARRAQAFEAHVIAVNRSGRSNAPADEVYRADALFEILPRADVVVLALPLAPDTRGFVDEGFLGRMREDSVLVNVARGAIVDEPALLAALERGRPAHAILDTVSAEPPPPDSPLWDHPRITLTGHLAGMGLGLLGRSDELFLDNLARFLRDEPLTGRVQGIQ